MKGKLKPWKWLEIMNYLNNYFLELKQIMCKRVSEKKHVNSKSNNGDGMLVVDINRESRLIEILILN